MAEARPGPARPVVVIGAGPVGMLLALCARRHGVEVLLVDARGCAAWDHDPRAIAVAEGSRHLLAAVDAWPAAAATPITEVHVSQQGGFARTLIRASDEALPALGHVIPYGDLCRALAAAVDAAGIAVRREMPVSAVTMRDDHAVVATPAGELAATLVIHAEGAGHGDDRVRIFDYRQDALLCEADPATPHGGRAWERFTPDGPVALLPCGRKLAVVLVSRRAEADALCRLDDAAYGREIERRLGGRLQLLGIGPRSRLPLALRLRMPLSAGRELWIGNAAQTLHPVSGQGLNLGLRDAHELAERLPELLAADRAEPDRTAARLAGLARRRQADRLAAVAFTDGIVRVFSNDFAPLRRLRGVGLALLDLVPPARSFLANRMIFGLRH